MPQPGLRTIPMTIAAKTEDKNRVQLVTAGQFAGYRFWQPGKNPRRQ